MNFVHYPTKLICVGQVSSSAWTPLSLVTTFIFILTL
uniref:Uncharacterized protein n=1 Tax=Arundo donax TaxID=35708 RepID=A0A0A9DWM2_ARUDO